MLQTRPLRSSTFRLTLAYLGLFSLSAALILGGSLWVLYLVGLVLMARPYRLLLGRRNKIGVRLITVLTVIPALIYLRQVGINIGQFKKRRHRGAGKAVNDARTP